MTHIEYSCPSIDECLTAIAVLKREMHNLIKNECYDVEKFLSYLETGLDDISHVLEYIREINDALRKYGKEQEELANDYLEELKALQEKVAI